MRFMLQSRTERCQISIPPQNLIVRHPHYQTNLGLLRPKIFFDIYQRHF